MIRSTRPFSETGFFSRRSLFRIQWTEEDPRRRRVCPSSSVRSAVVLLLVAWTAGTKKTNREMKTNTGEKWFICFLRFVCFLKWKVTVDQQKNCALYLPWMPKKVRSSGWIAPPPVWTSRGVHIIGNLAKKKGVDWMHYLIPCEKWIQDPWIPYFLCCWKLLRISFILLWDPLLILRQDKNRPSSIPKSWDDSIVPTTSA